MTEHVACVREEDVPAVHGFQEYAVPAEDGTVAQDAIHPGWLTSDKVWFLPRQVAEHDPRWKQLVV